MEGKAIPHELTCRCGNTITNVEPWLRHIVTWLCHACAGNGRSNPTEIAQKMRICKTCKDNLPAAMFDIGQTECKTCKSQREARNRAKKLKHAQ